MTRYHDDIVEAVLPYRGKILKTAKIKELCLGKTIPQSMVLPNDHCEGQENEAQNCWKYSCEIPCVRSELRIFDPVYRGNRKVRGQWNVREHIYWSNGSLAE